VAFAATADGNIETAPNGLAYNFLLKLRLHPFHYQFAATVTMCGRGHGDDFIDFLGNGLAAVLAVG
jgi:hypothetical protein